MKKNRLQLALEQVGRDPQLIDLIEGNFHKIGLIPPPDVFLSGCKDWLQQRSYRPESLGSTLARQSLAKYYQGRGFELNESQFVLTSGTSESYSLIFKTFSQPNDRILLPHPGYPLFEYICEHHHLDMDFYKLSPEQNFQITKISLENAWQAGTKFLVLISPSNPTGQIFNQESIDCALNFAFERGLSIIADEVFEPFMQNDVTYFAPGGKAPPVVVYTLNGVSKMFASPDLKLGWMAVTGPRKSLIPVLEALEVSADAYLSPGDYPQFLLPKLFETLKPFQGQVIELLNKNAKYLETWALKYVRFFKVWIPEGGIHCPIQLHYLGHDAWDDETWVVKILEDQKVYLHPGYFYDFPGREPWLVMSLLQTHEKFSEALKRLDYFFKDRLI